MRALKPNDPANTYAAVLDALPIVAYMADGDGAITYLSRGWERYTGNLAREVLATGYGVVIHADDLPGVITRWDVARLGGTSYRDEFRVRFGDGSYRSVLSQADPIRGYDGRIVGWFGTLTDIDDLRRTQETLARSEERYRLLGEALPGVSWTATPDGSLDHIAGRASTTSHLAPEERLRHAWLQIVHPDERERARERWQASLDSGNPYDTQFRVLRADGSYRWQLVRALAQRDADGSILRWVGMNVDIDDQRRADEAREQFVRLIEASDDFIGIADMDGNATYLNAAGCRMLGIASLGSADVPHAMMEYFVPADRAFVASEILPAIARDGRWVGDFRLRDPSSGDHIPVSYNAFSLLDDAGTPVAIATVARDLRERRRFEAGMQALADTGMAMYGALDFAGTVRNVASAVVRSFASFCVVDFACADGTYASIAARRDAGTASLVERPATARTRTADDPVVRAIESGQPTLLATLPYDWQDATGLREGFGDELDRLDVCSLLFVPIRSAGAGVCGVLTCALDAADPRGTYTVEDLRFAEEIAVRAGLAFFHARAYEHERRIAVTLQEASLPRELPALRGVHLSAAYRPGSDEATIGGDWYDAFVLDDGRLAITVGDVLGSGLGAAVTMGKVRQAMRSAATLIATPEAMLDVADRTIRAESDDTYATAVAGIYDPVLGTFTFASAGHPSPRLLDPDGRTHVCQRPGLLLGLRTRGAGETMTVSAPPGSTLLFFTDGLVEATRDIDEGVRRVHVALEDPQVAKAPDPAHALVEHVLRGEPATDDIAVLVARFERVGA